MRPKRLLALALCLSFFITHTLSGFDSYAKESDETVCANHTEHDEDCGYYEGDSGHPCLHIHGDECYVWQEAPSDAPDAGISDGEDVGEDTPSGTDAPEEPGAPEGTDTSEGTDIPEDADNSKDPYNDSSDLAPAGEYILDCKHVHDDECGYEPPIPSSPCNHACIKCHPLSILAKLLPFNLDEQGPHIPFEGYNFDVTVTLDSSVLEYDIDSIPIKVYIKDEEDPLEAPTEIKVNGTTGTISGIPVYYKEKTGNMQLGYTGTYETDEDFYRIEIDTTKPIQEGLYTVLFNSGSGDTLSSSLDAFINLSKDANDLVWSGTLAENKDGEYNALRRPILKAYERDVKTYNVTVSFMGLDVTTEYPRTLDKSFFLKYEENDNYYRVYPSEVNKLADSLFELTFTKVPTSEEIDNTLKIHVPLYRRDGKDFYIYREKGTDPDTGDTVYESITPNSTRDFDFYNIIYVEKQDLNGTIRWMDDGGSYPDGSGSVRPDNESLLGYLNVYSSADSSTPLDKSKYQAEILAGDNDDTLKLLISGLPMYEPSGVALNYYFKFENGIGVNEIPASEGADVAAEDRHKYIIKYNNGNNSSSAVLGYDAATVYFSLYKGNPQYTVNVEWRDDSVNNPNNQARNKEIGEGISLYLWRYAGNVDSAAAVYDEYGNQYKIDINSVSNVTIDINTIISNLPSYNENGKAYNYYLTGVNNGTYYEVSYSNDAKYLVNNGTIYLTRIGSEAFSATVKWVAAGEKDYVGTKSELILQQRLMGFDDPWVDTPDGKAVTDAIPDSITSISATFPYVELFDEEGKTYEFRVIEKRLIPTGENEDSSDDYSGSKITSINPERWDEIDSNRAVQSVRYLKHGYEIRINNSYNISMQGDSLNPRYSFEVENKLHEEVTFSFNSNWYYNSLYPSTVLQEELDRLLAREGDYENSTVSYTIRRTGETGTVDYVLLTLNPRGEDGLVRYSIKYLQNDYPDSEGILNISDVRDTGSGALSYRRWKFTFNVPKYDDKGKKYTYSEINETTHSGDEHGKIADKLKEHNSSLGIFIDRGSDTVNNSYSVGHRFLQTGISYYFTGKATWDDNLTDRGERVVEDHIIAYIKDGDNYYLYADLGDASCPLYTENKRGFVEGETGTIILNNENEFNERRGASLLKYDEIKFLNQYYNDGKRSIPIGSEEGLTPEALKTLQNETMQKVLYTVIEDSIIYKNEKVKIDWVDASGKINPIFMKTGADIYSLPIITDSLNHSRILFYPYDVDITEVIGPVKYHYDGSAGALVASKTYHHKLSTITGQINVNIEWQDDDNTSGYRKDALLIELYRSTPGKETTQVKDDEDKPVSLTLKWQEHTSDGIHYDSIFNNLSFPGDYPVFDENGNPIAYEIRQYICQLDEDGNITKKSLIDPRATENSTENRYITSSTNRREAGYGPDGYHQNLIFNVINSAANNNYSTSFYVVWHDEAAYKAGARSDMKYSLYYTLGEENPTELLADNIYDISDYNFVIETAEKGLLGLGSGNPYFQKLEFSGLKEFHTFFDEDNNKKTLKVHYFVKETKTDPTESFYAYSTEYYRLPQYEDKTDEENTLKKVEKIKGTILNNFYHRGFEEGTAASSLDFVGEKEVIINSIKAKLQVKGTKKWVNMTEDMEKPECFIYLFRQSDYDTDQKLPNIGDNQNLREDQVWEDDGDKKQNYVAKTTLINSHQDFSFRVDEDDEDSALTMYDKYDTYGSAYVYDIAEIIKTKDGKPVASSVMLGDSDGGMRLVNIYDPLKVNQQTLTIKKVWDKTETNHVPVAKFYVYRMECNYTEDDGSYPSAKTLSGEKIKNKIDSDKGSLSYEKYLETNAELITTVLAKEGVPIPRINDLKIYAPNGNPYIYFVVEDEAYVPSYTVSNMTEGVDQYEIKNNIVLVGTAAISESATSSQISLGLVNNASVGFKNTYKEDEKFLTIKGTISWSEGNSNIRSSERPTSFDGQIKLSVRRLAITQTELSGSDKNNILEEAVRYEGATDDFVPDDKITWDYNKGENLWEYTIEGEFLNFAQNGEPYTYYVQETLVSGSNTAINYVASPNKRGKVATLANTPGDVLTISSTTSNSIVNSLQGTFTVKKAWTDGYDSYGLRPNRVKIMFQYKAPGDTGWKALRYGAGVSGHTEGDLITLELSKANSWKASLTKFPIRDDAKNPYIYIGQWNWSLATIREVEILPLPTGLRSFQRTLKTGIIPKRIMYIIRRRVKVPVYTAPPLLMAVTGYILMPV